jgi:hypothetical protein
VLETPAHNKESAKKKPSSRRQLEEAQVRERELMDLVQRQKAEIEQLYHDLGSQDLARRELQAQVLLLQQRLANPGTRRRGSADCDELGGVKTPLLGSPLAGLSPSIGELGVCRNCMTKMSSHDVESALDLAIALGQAEQEVGDRDRKIAHLESKILELEDDREDSHKVDILKSQLPIQFTVLLDLKIALTYENFL